MYQQPNQQAFEWEHKVIPKLQEWNTGITFIAVELLKSGILDTPFGNYIFNPGVTLRMPETLFNSDWMKKVNN